MLHRYEGHYTEPHVARESPRSPQEVPKESLIEGVFLPHIGCDPKWKCYISPDADFGGESESGGPKLVSFLIRL
jgi:hypothetical protein